MLQHAHPEAGPAACGLTTKSNNDVSSPDLLARLFLPISMSTTPLVHPQSSEEVPRTFSVLQFNTLADSLSDAFPHVDHQNSLTFAWRWPLLQEEITRFGTDIIGLEEVDETTYVQYIKPFLNEKGYDGLFEKKRSPSNKDGTCLFWKTSSFSLARSESICLGERRTTQVAIFALLNSIHSDSDKSLRYSVCVAVTHLKAKLGFERVRESQVRVLTEHMDRFASRQANKDSMDVDDGANDVCDLRLVIGDFNDEPSSDAYNAMVGIGYRSAYKLYDSGQEPFTTAKKRATECIRCIDYVFYRTTPSTVWSCSKFQPTSLLSIPERNSIPHLLPCANYPSDHLAIGVVFSRVVPAEPNHA